MIQTNHSRARRALRALAPGLFGLLIPGPLAANPLTVGDLCRKAADALGGERRLEAVHAERMTGRIAFGSEAAVPLTVELKRPGKIRTQVDFAAGTFVQGFDGQTGWTIDPSGDPSGGGKPAAMTAEQAANLPEQADLDGPLVRWKEKGIRLEIEGREKVRERDAVRVRVTRGNGVIRFLDLDAKTFRKVRWAGDLGEGDRRQMNESYFSDYRRVGGLWFPFRIESGVGGRVTQTLVFDKVEVNPPIPDSRFEMPR